MLETIKSEIENIPDISFGEFYQHYIMEVQDSSLNCDIDEIRSKTRCPEQLSCIETKITQLIDNTFI